jgi:hypothetical protein
MTLDELQQTIIATEPDAWNVIVCWGHTSGPSYLDDFRAAEVDGEYRLEHEAHANRAVLKADVDIAFAWGLPVDPRDPKYFSEAWTQNFPDTTTFAQHCDILYRGALVDREVLIAVDGGRYKIAVPEQDTEELQPTKHVLKEWFLGPWANALGRLVTGCEGTYDYESALKRAGIVVRPGGEA